MTITQSLKTKQEHYSTMKLDFDTKEYLNEIKKNKNEYFHTFINRQSLAAGILFLKPREKDTQTPHDSDEIYYVIRGDGYLKIKKKDYPVSEGKVFFVAKNVEHYFFGNTKDLEALYFFGGPDP
jgi:mannose-6-phosphate isomerase-like protein (cupin superfamily)